jgi:hypothetical protein
VGEGFHGEVKTRESVLSISPNERGRKGRVLEVLCCEDKFKQIAKPVSKPELRREDLAKPNRPTAIQRRSSRTRISRPFPVHHSNQGFKIPNILLRLRRKPKPRRALRLIKDRINTLQKYISKDRHSDPIIRLNPTVARTPIDRCEVDVATRDDKHLPADVDIEIRQAGTAREHISALRAIVLRARDFRVIGFDSRGRDEQQRGSGVCNRGANTAGSCRRRANAVAGCRELPESAAALHRHISDRAGILRSINVSEIIRPRSAFLQIHGEKLRFQRALHAVEEGELRGGSHGVDAAESQAEEAVIVDVLGKLRGNLRRGLNGLRSGSHRADDDFVGVHVSAGAGAVLVGDFPGRAGELSAGG